MAAPRFSHPPHPSASIDPHNIPNFSSQSKSDEPVLYLPPILSSLPDGCSAVEAPSNVKPPIFTEVRLPDIDATSLSLHKALHHFKPITPDYANTPYGQAFNWSELKLPKDEEGKWFCAAFRSKRAVGSDGICECFLKIR